MITKRREVCTLGLALLLLFAGQACQKDTRGIPQPQSGSTRKTQIVLLGTGTPSPDPERSGPCTAIVVNGTPYLVDFGTGLVRRAAAARKKSVEGLDAINLKIGFVTHLHADHTLGFPDIVLTPWIMGRKEPLEVYGPQGTRDMEEHILKAYAADIKIRTEGLQRANKTGYKVNVHEINPGIIYRDQNVTVTAFAVHHGEWPQAYGYRFDTPDRTIVISGDTAPDEAVSDHCHGCDVLIHEVYTQASFGLVPKEWQQYRLAYHTSSKQLAAIASKAKPGLLILCHRSNAGCDQVGTEECRKAGSEEQLMKEIRQAYTGKVVAGHDLEVY